jgi:hypothetical protein
MEDPTKLDDDDQTLSTAPSHAQQKELAEQFETAVETAIAARARGELRAAIESLSNALHAIEPVGEAAQLGDVCPTAKNEIHRVFSNRFDPEVRAILEFLEAQGDDFQIKLLRGWVGAIFSEGMDVGLALGIVVVRGSA